MGSVIPEITVLLTAVVAVAVVGAAVYTQAGSTLDVEIVMRKSAFNCAQQPKPLSLLGFDSSSMSSAGSVVAWWNGPSTEVVAFQSGYQSAFKFVGGSKPASFQTERFSGAAISFTKTDAAFGAVLSVVAAAPWTISRSMSSGNGPTTVKPLTPATSLAG